MQWRGFEGLRTYERPLQNDLRELERFLRDMNDRLGRNMSSEPLNGQDGQNGTIGPHAFTHATQNSYNPTGGTDPLTPWRFDWTKPHTWTVATSELVDTVGVVYVSTTLANTNMGTTAAPRGAHFNITSPSGSATPTAQSHGVTALRVVLNAGYTGTARSYAVAATNDVAGTGTSIWENFVGSPGNGANVGVNCAAHGVTTTGYNVGMRGDAYDGKQNYGATFSAYQIPTVGTYELNVGLIALARNFNNTTRQIAGFFGLYGPTAHEGSFTPPTLASVNYNGAALIADSGDEAANAATFRLHSAGLPTWVWDGRGVGVALGSNIGAARIPLSIWQNAAQSADLMVFANSTGATVRSAFDKDGRLRFVASSTAATVAGAGSLYTKTFTRTELTYLDSSGAEVQITNLGGLNLTSASFANPTASVGLSVVNGTATTAMRSDAAPPLSQAIAPTWTAAHVWTPSAAGTIPIKVNAHASQSVDVFNVVADTSDNVAINSDGILRLRDVSALSGVYPGIPAPYGGLQDYGAAFSYGIVYAMYGGSYTELVWGNEVSTGVQLTSAGRLNVDTSYDYNWAVSETFNAGLSVTGGTLLTDDMASVSGTEIRITGDNLFVDNGNIHVEMGSSGDVFYVGGCFDDKSSDGANSGTSESDLMSTTVTGTTLNATGDKISAFYGGLTLGSATATTRLRVYFAGTVIWDSTAIAFTANADWSVYVELIVESSSGGHVRCITTAETTTAMAGLPYVQYTRVASVTIGSNQILKITGQRAGAGAATSDILLKMGHVFYTQANT
jgi:hypothetical protein